jgi:hypothetical protein
MSLLLLVLYFKCVSPRDFADIKQSFSPKKEAIVKKVKKVILRKSNFYIFKNSYHSISQFLHECFCIMFSGLNTFCSPGLHYSKALVQEKNP